MWSRSVTKQGSMRWSRYTTRRSAATTARWDAASSLTWRTGPAAGQAFVAYAGATPISAGRVSFHAGTDFAGLWGGGTIPAWRGRGVFRSLVSHRAVRAAAAGFRYLQVDASADSCPILQRLGFVEMATTIPFVMQTDPQ